jgi:hypothetical protein
MCELRNLQLQIIRRSHMDSAEPLKCSIFSFTVGVMPWLSTVFQLYRGCQCY